MKEKRKGGEKSRGLGERRTIGEREKAAGDREGEDKAK